MGTVQNVLDIALVSPGHIGQPFDLLQVFTTFTPLFNCTGPVALDYIRYTNDTLTNLQMGAPLCENKTYQVNSTAGCGTPDYAVSYCLERLDDATASSENGVEASRPGLRLLTFSVVVAMLFAMVC